MNPCLFSHLYLENGERKNFFVDDKNVFELAKDSPEEEFAALRLSTFSLEVKTLLFLYHLYLENGNRKIFFVETKKFCH